jgi:beta-N-acetylhexosaminidase
VQQIAALALQTIHNGSIPSIKESRISLFAPELVRKAILQTSFATLGKTITSQFFTTLNPGQDETIFAQNLAKDGDIIIFCSYNAWKNSAQASLIDLLKNTKKPMILISLRDPIDASLFPDIPLIISTFSPTAPSIQAAADLLKRENP